MTQLLVKTIADFQTTLTTKTAVGATTGTLTSGLDTGGVQLPTGTYGFTVDRNNAQKEHFTATLTGSNLTDIKTVTVGTGVGTAGLLKTHRKGSEVIISDHVAIKRMMNVLDGTTNLDSAVPLGYDGTASITTANQIATKAYVDGVAVAGGPNASTTVKGLVEEATQAQRDNGTATGETGARLFINPSTQRETKISDFVADTGTVNTYVIDPSPVITAYSDGQIFTFRAGSTNTGATTINVNSKGARAVTKNGFTPLQAGDIVDGQFVMVQYFDNGDGTYFQMLSTPSGLIKSVDARKFGGDGSDGALALTSGATNIDLGNAAVVTKNYTSISITGTGQLTFTNPATTGTTIILKSQGNVTLTSSANPNINASGLGAAGGAANTAGSTSIGIYDTTTHTGGVGTAGSGATPGVGGTAGAIIDAQTLKWFFTNTTAKLERHHIFLVPGNGGTGGRTPIDGAGTAGGAGGRGGGALKIEVGGTLNFTGTISVAGADGIASANATAQPGGGGGGGGSSGHFLMLYNTLTANSGTVSTAGGAGGKGADTTDSGNGYAGGSGSGSAGFYVGGVAGGAGGADTGNGVAGTSAGAETGVGGGGGGGGGANGARTGGAGGSGGTSNTNLSLITKNYWFA